MKQGRDRGTGQRNRVSDKDRDMDRDMDRETSLQHAYHCHTRLEVTVQTEHLKLGFLTEIPAYL